MIDEETKLIQRDGKIAAKTYGDINGWYETVKDDPPSLGVPSPPTDPRPKYNIFSWLCLFWIEPLLWLGLRKGITQENLYPHPHEADSEKLLNRFNRFWKTELERKKDGKTPRLFFTLLRCLLWRFLLQGFIFFMETALLVSSSVILGYLTEHLALTSPSEEDTRNAYLLAFGLVVCGVLIMSLHIHTLLLGLNSGMMSRIIMTAVVYQKVTTLSQVAIGRISIGRIVNLASNDIQRFDLVFLLPHVMWIAPLLLIVSTYLAHLEIGWSALLLTGFILIQVPFQFLLAKIFARLRFKSALVTDSRIRNMNEIITGIKVIKMYAWEYAFKAVVSKLRRLESTIILKGGIVRAFSLAFMIVSITIMTFIVFSVYTGTGGVLTPKKVFTILSLLITLRLFCVHYAVKNALFMTEGYVALSRIQKLLDIEELNSDVDDEENSQSEASVTVDNLSASWTYDAANTILSGVTFKVTKENRLLSVVGPVGAGKSTLLQCLLRELSPMEGTVKVNGKLSYTSQEPWLFSASLRDNILFGNSYDPDRYQTVIEGCALIKDISQLIDGDLTLVGERGVTLSGGQKARVSLARAVYHDAEIYLLDDPLSAVDTAVAKHLFDKCIRGILKNHLVVLVTHQVQFAAQSDQILALKEGRMEVYGNVKELLAKDINLKQLLGLLENEDRSEKEETLSRSSSFTGQACFRKDLTLGLQDSIDQNSPTDRPDPSSSDTGSLRSSSSSYSLHSEVATRQDKYEEKIRQTISLPPEEKAHGSLSFKTYIHYFRAGGSVFVLLLMILAFIVGEVSLVVADWWISDWAQCSVVNGTSSLNRSTCLLSTGERIGIFASVTVGTILLNFTRAVLLYAVCINASRVLHNRMFASVLRSPMLFFDTNPIGRVLNRFSKDVGFLDDLLPYVYCEYLLWLSRAVSILITAIVAIPWFIIPCVLFMVLFLALRFYYIKTARELKRLEAIARSPVYSHISTTLQGLPIIRLFGKKEVAMDQFHSYQNNHTKSYYLYIVLSRWLVARMDALSTVLLTIVAFSAVPLSSVFDPALIGLALTYTISVTSVFQFVVRQSTEVENIMISSERIMGYSRLEQEASFETQPADKRPALDWPSQGRVSLENVSFQYSSELPLVLSNLTFTIQPAEKVGVVGRTGAGKSSLLSVLFRLAEPHGLITIDGVDIKSIGLHDVRSKMSIIPQDPVLFSGTVRYNLDPFDDFSESDLWDVLEQVQLKVVVEQLEGQLSGEVSEGGNNFSVGQKQLVCLARALLRKNKILILDEATANVDLRTDEIIQQAIREKFTECTVITIAHRLNTIMDSDRILVLSDGLVKEFDTPYHLLQDCNSLFAEMIEQTGPTTSRKLRQMVLKTQ